ncbi:C-C chemokine receptor type 5-like isoform X1 [Hippocampus zosterae]|uniref:C-C chemokine receptor type 5-like isoform X1 n=1 Tax=Hippocampus zosterae TaxID=109293 RepID=UPI00223DEF70|nr:C-C chemokine receptor type 5-like isoform X1 [Hippocampus zosterae]XP_051944789.1 C-C chemokine receptor type 5-like isoform X1 [Hippocampus zosterae]
MESSIGQSPTMDSMEDQYAILLELLKMNETYDPSYVVSDTVKLCTKVNVNDFGSKFNPPFCFVNFLLSYLGNGLVLYIIYKYEKLNTVTNIFLLNLVLSNILFATSLPFWATYHLSQWIFGNILCKLVSSAYFIGFYSSILFLTLMTFDRYLAVVHAVAAAKSRKRSYAIISSVVVWCVSIIASMKELVFQNVWTSPFDELVCEESGYSEATMAFWRLVTYYQQFLVFFLLPLLMVIYCYVCITVRVLSTRMKEKCRAVKLIFIIIFTFFVCWTPYNVVILLKAIQSSSPNVECAESDKLDYAMFVTRNVAYLYCCISPVFYTFVGKKFQSHFKRLLAKKIPCLRRHISLSSQSTRTTSQKTPHSDYEY